MELGVHVRALPNLKPVPFRMVAATVEHPREPLHVADPVFPLVFTGPSLRTGQPQAFGDPGPAVAAIRPAAVI